MSCLLCSLLFGSCLLLTMGQMPPMIRMQQQQQSADVSQQLPQFLNHCQFCPCWSKYEERDIKLPSLPYGEAVFPSEDECLALCTMDFPRCKSVTYGVVGGDVGVICEFYQVADLQQLSYQYGMNYYEPRRNRACEIDIPAVRDSVKIQIPAEAGRAAFRKLFALKPNPYANLNDTTEFSLARH